jgi:hypothetical protein
MTSRDGERTTGAVQAVEELVAAENVARSKAGNDRDAG